MTHFKTHVLSLLQLERMQTRKPIYAHLEIARHLHQYEAERRATRLQPIETVELSDNPPEELESAPAAQGEPESSTPAQTDAKPAIVATPKPKTVPTSERTPPPEPTPAMTTKPTPKPDPTLEPTTEPTLDHMLCDRVYKIIDSYTLYEGLTKPIRWS